MKSRIFMVDGVAHAIWQDNFPETFPTGQLDRIVNMATQHKLQAKITNRTTLTISGREDDFKKYFDKIGF